MSAFFDTNSLIYAQQNDEKADKARALLAAGGILSVQVINEFAAVARRTLAKEWDEIGEAIEDVLALVDPPVPLSLMLHATAREIARDHNFGFYDALIVATALDAECDTLFTEDLQDGRALGALRIVNPFRVAR